MDVMVALYQRIGVIHARAQIRLANAVALGSGHMRADEHRKHWRALERQAEVAQPRLLTSRPTPAALAMLGIKVA